MVIACFWNIITTKATFYEHTLPRLQSEKIPMRYFRKLLIGFKIWKYIFKATVQYIFKSECSGFVRSFNSQRLWRHVSICIREQIQYMRIATNAFNALNNWLIPFIWPCWLHNYFTVASQLIPLYVSVIVICGRLLERGADFLDEKQRYCLLLFPMTN